MFWATYRNLRTLMDAMPGSPWFMRTSAESGKARKAGVLTRLVVQFVILNECIL